ncbi:hypothetical protein JB92DRAFT_1409142 [Gautieria morchelliformis]|nr:hypothetical protein JB92DRAFT_1409142 [Gautieria morchelliformis]
MSIHCVASPGAVLVIVGWVAFVALGIITWAEVACAPRRHISRVRTEVILVPLLIIFQLAVVTSDTIKSVCQDPSSCVALVVLSWLTPFSLLVYFLMVLAITFDHAQVDPSIWDASFLDHPWFTRLPHKDNVGPSSVMPSAPPRIPPSVADHRRQLSSWLPLSLRASSESEFTPPQRLSLQASQGSAKSSLMPRWAKNLRPLQRGKELPFPITTQQRRYSNPRRIDAPVSPTIYTENF